MSFSEENLKKQLQLKEEINKSSYKEVIFEKIEKEPAFEHFFLLGYEYYAQTPSILAMFPSKSQNITNNYINVIIEYCYPFKIGKIMHLTEPCRNNIITGFVFNFMQDEKLLYGVVLHVIIPQNNHHIGPKFDHSYPFSLCIISKYADICSHFTFLCEINNLILLKKPFQQNVSIVPPIDLQNQEGDIPTTLVLDSKTPLIAISPNIPSFHFLINTLLNYYSTNMIPTLKQNYYLLYPTMQTLFTFLTIDQIVKVYTYILLEKKILFLSKSLNRLSFCVLAASNLLKKLNIEAKIYPIFPTYAAYRDLLDMPFTSIFGFPCHSNEKVRKISDKFDLIIDLDEGQILKEAKIPQLPRKNILTKNLHDLLKEKRPEVRILPKLSIGRIIETQKVTPDFILLKGPKNQNIYPKCFQYFAETKYIFNPEIIQIILDMFHKIPFTFADDDSLIEKIFPCIVTDTSDENNPVSVFNQSLFLTMFNDDDATLSFMQDFLNTQIFSLFVEKIVDDFQKNKTSRARNISQDSMKIESIKKISQNIYRSKSNVVKT